MKTHSSKLKNFLQACIVVCYLRILNNVPYFNDYIELLGDVLKIVSKVDNNEKVLRSRLSTFQD